MSEFPTDDVTLGMLEAACVADAEGRSHLMEFLSFGAEELEPIRHVDPETGDYFEIEAFAGGYHETEVILALIAEIRALRNADLPSRRSAFRRAVGVLLGRVRTMLGRGGDRGRPSLDLDDPKVVALADALLGLFRGRGTEPKADQ